MRKELSIIAGLVALLSARMLANEDVPAVLEHQTQVMLDAVSSGSSAQERWERGGSPAGSARFCPTCAKRGRARRSAAALERSDATHVPYRDPRRNWPRTRAYASGRTLGADRRLNPKM
jgi:hypothetical protein